MAENRETARKSPQGGEMKIAVVSGSRADAGPLSSVYEQLREHGHKPTFFDLSTYKPAYDTRHAVAWLAADVQRAVCQSLQEFDLVLILGDRSEILAVAVAAFLLGKPIAHLSGGDITEGSQDDSMRHAITQLAHFHFVTNSHSGNVLLQLGVEAWRIHNVGCPSIDRCFGELFDRRTTMREIAVDKPYIMVVYHPNTIEPKKTKWEFEHLKLALDQFPSHDVVCISPNTDFGESKIRWKCRVDLTRKLYLSALKHAECLVGNSSSAIYEAPVLGTPCVNIGDRQKGRYTPPLVCSVRAHSTDIIRGIDLALHTIHVPDTSAYYGDGTASRKIAEIITNTDLKQLMRKKFNVCHRVGGDPQEQELGEIPERTTGEVGLQDIAAEQHDPGYWVWSGGGDHIPS